MNSIKKVFFKGFITLLPIALTAYILYSGILVLENLLGNLLKRILPEAYYIPGLGFFLTLSLIYGFGLLLNNFLAARILSLMQNQLVQVPFIKTIYSPLRDLMNLFNKEPTDSPQSVVMVKWGTPAVQMLGLVTREDLSDLHLGTVVQDHVAVYIPFSYALGGYTVLAHKDSITAVDLPIDRAMTLAITGWVATKTPPESGSESGSTATSGSSTGKR